MKSMKPVDPKHKFCSLCGRPVMQVALAAFDTETGEQLTKARCPNLECGHDGRYPWHSYAGWFHSKCVRCGALEKTK